MRTRPTQAGSCSSCRRRTATGLICGQCRCGARAHPSPCHDRHRYRTPLAVLQAQIDNGLPKGFGKNSGSAARHAPAGAGRAREKRTPAVLIPEVRLQDATATSDQRGTGKSRGQQRSRSRRRRPASAGAVLPHTSGHGRVASDRRPAHGSSIPTAGPSGGVTSARRSMTAEGAAIYDDFVELLSCFDKVSTHCCRSAQRYCIRTASELTYAMRVRAPNCRA